MFPIIFLLLLETGNSQINHLQTVTLRRNHGGNLKLAYCYVDPVVRAPKGLSPVILLHGVLDSKLTWHSFAPKIASLTGRRVYYIDARNHGNSPWNEEFNFDVLADDLEYFMDTHRIPKAILVGHSMGGRTALTLALRRPEKVEKLFVEDMTVKDFSPQVGGSILEILHGLRQMIAAVPGEADEITARQTIATLMLNNLPPDMVPASKDHPEESLLQLPIKKSENGYSWKTNLDIVEKAFGTPGHFNQHLSGRYPKEAMFLYGTNSFFDVANDETDIKKFFPNAQLKAVPGSGHLIHHQHSKIFMRELVSFINSYRRYNRY